MKPTEIEYTALRSRPGFENERVTVKGFIEPGETPIAALTAAKKIVDEFLGPSQAVLLPEGDGPIIPNVDLSKIETIPVEQALDRSE